MAFLRLSSVFLAMMVSESCYAAQVGDEIETTFQGQFLLYSPCTLNGDRVTDIDFGDVGVDKVDGIRYIQNIPYSVDCHGAPDNMPLNLSISGNVQPWNPAALVTDADGLGIEIQSSGQPFSLNVPISTTVLGVSSFSFTAVPVKESLQKELSPQPFSAVATMTVEYQ